MLIQPGDAFDADRLDRSLRTLFATGLFRDVAVTRVGDTIRVRVEENPIVNRVAFEGNSKVSDDVLRPEVQLRTRSVFTPQAAQADRQRMLDLYARRGRFAARIEPKVIPLDQNRVDVVYEITEGDAALVQGINFVGNTAFSDGRLRDVVATREQACCNASSPPQTYDPERLPSTGSCCAATTANGYATCRWTAATAELAPDRSGFFVTFTFRRGPALPHRQHRPGTQSRWRGVDGESFRRGAALLRGDGRRRCGETRGGGRFRRDRLQNVPFV
jgi:outer membrane protein insertion porin family